MATARCSVQVQKRWVDCIQIRRFPAWNLFTLAGILLGRSIPGLEHLGLDFSIAATFIALVAPLVRNVPTVVCVATALFCSVLFSYWQWSSALVLAGLAGMAAGFVCNKLYREAPWSGQ